MTAPPNRRNRLFGRHDRADPIIGDPRYLIGDGKVSASPQSGSVYVCSQDFRDGGAQHTGDWVVGDYGYPARKITAQGEIDWPSAQVSFISQPQKRPHDWSAQMPPSTVPTKLKKRAKQVTP